MSVSFSANQSIGHFISFDDNRRCFKLEESGQIVSYDNIAGYRYMEEKGSMGKGGIARAFSIGVLGENKGLFIATKMCIKIVLEEGDPKELFINILITPTKSNNIVYRSLKASADNIISKLESIQPVNCEKDEFTMGYADELRQLKRLVEEGVITEEDYSAKKRKILGI